MKPNEGCAIGQDDLIAQIGLLILEGRTLQDVKSNMKDYKNWDDGLIHFRKEDFMSLWKSCDSLKYTLYIEVWLYHQEQFNDSEAMDGHSGYLLIEQWEIEIKLNRNSEHGFHCSGKMLIQAIHSKLYFSQLSAWLSLTHGKFPKHIYFRVCQTENKTPLTRFIRAPDFHQFPEVNIATTKELVVCLHSLPHSDLTSEYPMFSWALTDQPCETPQRKIPEKLSSNFREDLVSKDDSYPHNRSQDKHYSLSPSHVIRKLQFENVSLAVEKSSDKQQCVKKNADKSFLFETLENINTTRTKQPTSTTEWKLLGFSATKQNSKYFAEGIQNLVSAKKEVVCSLVSDDDISMTHFDLSRKIAALDSPQDQKLLRKEMKIAMSGGSVDDKEKISAKSFVSKSEADKQLQGSFYEGCLGSVSQSEICEAKELNVSTRKLQGSSTISKEQMREQGICEVVQSSRKDNVMPPLCPKTDSYEFASGQAHECEKKFVSIESKCLENSCDSENVGNNVLNSEFYAQDICRKSLLTRYIGASISKNTTLSEDFLEYSQNEEHSPSKVYGDLNRKQGYSNDRRLKSFERASLDRPSSNSENSKTKAYSKLRSNEMIINEDRKSSQVSVDEQSSNSRCLILTRSSSIDEYSDVLDRTRKEIGDILPEGRHVIDNDYEKTLNEGLRKCWSPSQKSLEKKENGWNKNVRKTEEIVKKEKHVISSLKDRHSIVALKDNVFSEQKFTAIPSRNSRYHFRHASTGTLTVFHPRTGLPVSSSPAPFRKTSQKQTVDDICSPSREPSSLSDQCGNLSKSAPTLTTQSLLVNFEESVLNDRLRPDGVVEGFTAELSASSSKKCLPHVTLPVQAYFFKLSDDNAPSPYMGYISLDVPGLPTKGYHVPKKGTIQLTLFNPNQTVVKVFIVLYDFSDMQPNFQTFLRQKTTSLVQSDVVVDRIHDNLHYLIHLRFASSKSGRIYLHTDIRVIFARHPPDQGNLRTTTSGPTNPKYVPRHDLPGGF